MASPTKNNSFTKVLIVLAVLIIAGIYSCNNSATSTEAKKDTVVVPVDTTLKLKADSSKAVIDTNKGDQKPPPRN
jgi:hypothetical protein